MALAKNHGYASWRSAMILVVANIYWFCQSLVGMAGGSTPRQMKVLGNLNEAGGTVQQSVERQMVALLFSAPFVLRHEGCQE